jgi:DNA repair protein RadC
LPSGSSSIELVVKALRATWQSVEASGGADAEALKREISDTVQRLRGRVERKLRDASTAIAPPEPLLFDALPKDRRSAHHLFEPPPRFPTPKLRVFAKDLADHALKHIPKLSGCQSIGAIRTYLTGNLRFNSEATRRRNANYLINRFFPSDVLHHDVLAFAAAAEGRQALGDALFYLTGRTEKIVSLVAEEVVFPSLTEGGVSRTRIRDFVQAQLPNSKSASEVGSAIVGTYQTYGIGSANRTRLNVVLRDGCLASFAYILHLEFPEPGMHAFDKMFDGPMHRWLLWDQQWMVQQLYRLREIGLLSKVSEIDRMRQFTTKHILPDDIQRIAALAQDSTA